MQDVFEKTGPESSLAMFEAEAQGLDELRASNTIRVPEVLDCGVENGRSFLRLERLKLGPATDDVERRLGEQLAAMHRCTNGCFGWHRDNTIGLTLQENGQLDDWGEFFGARRIGFQLELAAANGYAADIADAGARLCDRMPRLLGNHEPAASLLHGDLWGGNWGSVGGEPVVFDPAVYYGDRETDLAMTMLFGGFGPAFYAAYRARWPLASGHEQRFKLYQLYHVLNHLNLFGRSYLQRARDLIDELNRAA